MNRLTAYLVRLFSIDAIALFVIVSLLLFLVQTLRTFDLVTAKGQDLPTLVGQTLLSMPTIITAFAYVCIAIGLARGLRLLGTSNEMPIIHASRCTGSLFRAIAIYVLLGAALVQVLTHLVEPVSKRHYNVRQAAIAADLVSRTLTPGRFIEMTPGVTILIGSRGARGEIGDFFADDRRDPNSRRTFISQSATFAVDDRGFVIRMRDGSIQNMADSARYSEIGFATYDLAIDHLTRRSDAPVGVSEASSVTLVSRILSGDPPSGTWEAVVSRTGEGLRVVALCLMVAAFAAFPTGRRVAGRVPLEIVVILLALGERLLSDTKQLQMGGIPAGSLIIATIALAVIGARLIGVRLPGRRGAVTA